MSFDNNITVTAQEVASTLTGLFRTFATNLGWPQDVARKVSVRYEEGNLSYDISEADLKDVDDLEYGEMGNPPKPAMRNFKAKADEMVSDIMGEAWSSYLFGKDGI